MRKLVLSLVASALLLFGLSTPAHAAGPTYCTNTWFVHGPYPVGGGMQSWLTCVTNGTGYSSPPDLVLSANQGWVVGVDTVELRAYLGGSLVAYGVNYTSAGTYSINQSTVVAAASGCVHNAVYQTFFHFYNAGSHAYEWGSSGPGMVRC